MQWLLPVRARHLATKSVRWMCSKVGIQEVEKSRDRVYEILKQLDDQVFDDGDWPSSSSNVSLGPPGSKPSESVEVTAEAILEQINCIQTVGDVVSVFKKKAAGKSAREECTEFLVGMRVLGFFITDPVKVGTSILSALSGLGVGKQSNECVVHILHAVPLNADEDEVQGLFPKEHQLVLVREPKLTVYPDAQHGSHTVMVVRSPADVMFLGLRLMQGASASEFNVMGNEFMARKRYEMARNCYMEAKIMIQGAKCQELVVYTANTAEAFLRLGMYDSAIQETGRALEIDPMHVKSILKRARALCAVQEHEDALECLQNALNSQRSKKVIVEAVATCKVLVEQSNSGRFDLSSFLKSGLKKEAAPECSDYFGPVEVKLCEENGPGRGLFVTEDVKMGELLLVSNPIGYVHSSEGNVETDLVVKVVKTWMGSSKDAIQCHTLCEEPVVPDSFCMLVFQPNSKWHDKVTFIEYDATVDIAKVKKLAIRGMCAGDGELWTGLWGLPSFINHSCMPNVSRTFVGKAMFIRAARDLRAGEELRVSYVDALLSSSEQRKRLLMDNWGFSCRCKRCAVREEQGSLLEDIALSSPDCSADKVVEQVEQALQDLKARDRDTWERDKDIIRSGYMDSYASCDFDRFVGTVDGFPRPVDVLALLHKTAAGDARSLALMASLVKNHAQVGEEGRKLLESEVTALFGVQDAEVVESVTETALANGYLYKMVVADTEALEATSSDDEGQP